jgi:hypothetical protein
MQSRVAAAAATARRSPLVLSLAHNQALRRELASSSAGRTADPDIHSGEVEAGPDVYYRKNEVGFSLFSSLSLITFFIFIFLTI